MSKIVDARKYSLIDKKVFDWQEKEKESSSKGICIKKFHADFVIDGLTDKYKLGDEITLNSESCHITQVGKRCFPDECDLYKELGHSCLLKNGVMFAG